VLLGDNYKAINFNFVNCLSLDGDKHANKVVAWHCWFLTFLFCEDVMKHLPLSICVEGEGVKVFEVQVVLFKEVWWCLFEVVEVE